MIMLYVIISIVQGRNQDCVRGGEGTGPSDNKGGVCGGLPPLNFSNDVLLTSAMD